MGKYLSMGTLSSRFSSMITSSLPSCTVLPSVWVCRGLTTPTEHWRRGKTILQRTALKKSLTIHSRRSVCLLEPSTRFGYHSMVSPTVSYLMECLPYGVLYSFQCSTASPLLFNPHSPLLTIPLTQSSQSATAPSPCPFAPSVWLVSAAC